MTFIYDFYKKKVMKNLVITSLVLLLLLAGACQKSSTTSSTDNTTTCSVAYTYNADIKTIIEASCLSSGCHGSGSSRGDFTTYSGLKTYITNGSFKREVITTKNMPEGSSLSSSQLSMISCWLDSGAPEN